MVVGFLEMAQRACNQQWPSISPPTKANTDAGETVGNCSGREPCQPAAASDSSTYNMSLPLLRIRSSNFSGQPESVQALDDVGG
jgi:hypothetical protein